MSLPRGGPPVRQVPTLTEVVEPLLPTPAAAAAASSAISAPAPLAPAPAALPAAPVPVFDEQALVERVLTELQRQIDPVIEQKLRETLAPTLALVAEMLVHDSRDQLTGVLRDMAQRALAEALVRQRRG